MSQVIEEVTARMRELELTAEEYVDCIEEALAAAFKDTSNDYKYNSFLCQFHTILCLLFFPQVFMHFYLDILVGY